MNSSGSLQHGKADSMKAQEEKLKKLLKQENRYLIPLWQRRYAWDKAQWKVVWEDLEDSVNAQASKAGPQIHFFGAMILSTSDNAKQHVGDPDEVIVIDGQQRLTTCLILLAAIRDALGSNGDINFKTYLRNDDAKNGLPYKLIPQEGDQEMFFNILDGAPINANVTPLASDESVEGDDENQISAEDEADEADDPYFQLLKDSAATDRVSRAYLYFKQQLDDRLAAGLPIENVVAALENFDVVSITLHPSDSWQRIFETVNALGVDLEDSDLVRNYIFMRIPEAEQKAIYVKSWHPMESRLSDHLTDFLLSFAVSRGVKTSAQKKSIYRGYRYELSKPEDSATEIVKLVRTLDKESKTFLDVLKNDDRDCWKSDVGSRLEFLAQWGAVPMHPLLLLLLRQLAKSEKDLELCLWILQSFVVRRFLAGTASSSDHCTVSSA